MSQSPPRRPAPTRAAFRYFHPLTTRWADNDFYGHVNNAVYYSWIDTAVTRFLIDRKLLDIANSPVVCVVAETGCRYMQQLAFPDLVTVGVAVTRLGRSSVRYAAGIFRDDDETAAAEGYFVHVYVDRMTMRPVPIPDAMRPELQKILMEGDD